MMVDQSIASKFDELYNSTQRSVLSFIAARCGSTADISDIFQETYAEFYKLLNRRGVEYVTNGKALILRIAKRKIARHYSFLERIRMVLPLSIKNEDGDEAESAEFEPDSFALEDFAENRLLLEEARQYVQSKPEMVQKVFYLFYDLDMSIAETAAALSISESNVKHKLYRTLKELRSLLH